MALICMVLLVVFADMWMESNGTCRRRLEFDSIILESNMKLSDQMHRAFFVRQKRIIRSADFVVDVVQVADMWGPMSVSVILVWVIDFPVCQTDPRFKTDRDR
jgi:hypothetical protein